MNVLFLQCGYAIGMALLLFFALRYAERRTFSLRSSIEYWVAFGIIVNLISHLWIYSIYPLQGMGAWYIQLEIFSGVYLLTSLVAGLPFCLVGAAFFLARTSPLYRFLLVPFAFAATEILSSFCLSVLYMGDGVGPGVHWQSEMLGNILAPTPLVELAYIGGAFGLTYVLSYLLYLGVIRRKLPRPPLFLLPILALYLFVHFLVPVHGPKDPVHIELVDTNFSDKDFEGRTDAEIFAYRYPALHTQVLAAVASHPDIIALPEELQYIQTSSEKTRATLSDIASTTLFVDGEKTLGANGLSSNDSVFYRAGDRHLSRREKRTLFPFGEYYPYFLSIPISYLAPSDFVDALLKKNAYSVSATSPLTYTFDTTRIGTLLCSEALSYDIIHTLAAESPDLVFYQSYLYMFRNSALFEIHHLSFTQIAAAQLRAPVLQVTNGSTALVVNGRGEIIDIQPGSFANVGFEIQGEHFTKLP